MIRNVFRSQNLNMSGTKVKLEVVGIIFSSKRSKFGLFVSKRFVCKNWSKQAVSSTLPDLLSDAVGLGCSPPSGAAI